MKANYTIIIPHHNIPFLLKRCLDSIPDRDDIQIIVVDDKSDQLYHDELTKVCMSKKHVELIRLSQNRSAGGARNEALKVARGKFVLFSDADDYFNYCINDILDEYLDTPHDIIYFKAGCVDNYTYEIKNRTHHLNAYIQQWETDRDVAEINLRYMFGEPWCKLIRRNIIEDNNIRFDETRRNNDTTFSYLVGHYAHSVSVDKRLLYTYTVGRSSLSVQRTISDYIAVIDVFSRSELFFRTHSLRLKEIRFYLALYSICRSKNSEAFKEGVEMLCNRGFNRREIYNDFSMTVARNSIVSPLWCCVYVPYIQIKLLCLFYFFLISIPRFIMYKVLRIKDKTIKRW